MIKKESKQQDTIVLSDDEVDKEANRRESSHQELDRNRHNARADEAVTTRRSSRTAKVGSARKSQPLPKKAGLSRKGKEKAGPENIVQSRDDREETVGRATSAPRRPSSAVPLGNATCPEEHHTVTATALDPNTPSATGQTGTNEAPAPRGAIEAGRKRNHDEFGPYTTPVIQPRCSKIRHVEMRQSPAETEDMYGPPAHRLPASTGAQSLAELPATPPPTAGISHLISARGQRYTPDNLAQVPVDILIYLNECRGEYLSRAQHAVDILERDRYMITYHLLIDLREDFETRMNARAEGTGSGRKAVSHNLLRKV